MLVEFAIGDAYGAAFEFVDAFMLDHLNDLQTYYKHPYHDLGKGRYTDDTQMSIAVAEALVDGRPFTKELFAEKFLECFNRDQRVGYASGFYNFLLSAKDTKYFLKHIKDNSNRNGAAMRSGPIGYLKSPHEILEAAQIQAGVTHNTPGGIMSSQAIALMYHYLIYNKGNKEKLGEYIEHWLPEFKWSDEFIGTVPIEGMHAAHAAISTVQRCLSLQEVLLRAVNYGGDTDTAAALSLGAASCSNEMIKDLPEHLYNDLENGIYGRDYLKLLEYKLNALYRTE